MINNQKSRVPGWNKNRLVGYVFYLACLSIWPAVVGADPPFSNSDLPSAIPADLESLPMVAVLHSWGTGEAFEGVARASVPWHAPWSADSRLPSVWVWDAKRKTTVAAQTSVIARRGDGKLSVVDLVFPVSMTAGAPTVLRVFVGGKPSAPNVLRFAPNFDPRLRPNLIEARMHDALGREYRGDLFAQPVAQHSSGPHERLDEFFAVMRPVQPHPNALPQLFRLHTFVAVRAGEPWLDIKVMVENSCQDQPADAFYFDSLELSAKEGRVQFATGSMEEAHPQREDAGRTWCAVIDRNQDGSLHLVPDCQLTTFRFAVSETRDTARCARRLAAEPLFIAVDGRDGKGRRTWSWNSLAAFGPSWIGVPKGDRPMTDLFARLEKDASTPASRHPLLARHGPFWVHGDQYGDAPSGEDVGFVNPTAIEIIQAGGGERAWHRLQDVFRASLHRQRFGFWKKDGTLWTLLDQFEGDAETLAGATPRLNIFSGRPHSEPYCFQFGRPEARASAAWKMQSEAGLKKTARYSSKFTGYTNYDDEHLCRFTQRLFALVWLGNDPVAKKILEAQAAISMAASNPFPQTLDGTAGTGTLAELRQHVARFPHGGSFHLSRGAGWNMQAVLGGLAVTNNAELKRLGDRWKRDFSDLWPEAQLPGGGVHRAPEEMRADVDLNGDGVVGPEERQVLVDHGSVYMQGIFRFAGCRSLRFALNPQKHAPQLAKLEAACRRLDQYFISRGWDRGVDLPGWATAVSTQADRAKLIPAEAVGAVWGGSESSKYYFADVLAEAHEMAPKEPYLAFLLRMYGGQKNAVDRAGGNSAHAIWVLDQAN